MCHRTGQFDVAHALTTNLGKRDFHAALLTDHSAVLEALVFAAQALIVFGRTKDLGAEQAIAFRLESTVVNGFRFFDFAIRPGSNHLGRGEANTKRIEFFGLPLLPEYV